MADINVKLGWFPKSLTLDKPKAIKYKKGQTINFEAAPKVDGVEVHITFNDPGIFSAQQLKEGGPDVTVVGKPIPTTYRCELFVNGKLKSKRDGKDGGEMVPDQGNQG